MTLPVYLHSGMTGAPALMAGNNNIITLLTAGLVDGFNTKTPTSASSNGSTVSLVYATDPGFEVASTITVSGATNALYNGNFRVVTTGTTVTVTNTAAPAGSIAGTLSTKYASLGWTRPYTGTGLAAYRQGGSATHKRYLRVYAGNSSTSGRYYVRGYEAMTAISTGTGPFPTTTEVAGNGPDLLAYYNGVGPAPWALVGTPRAFYFMCAYEGSYDGTTPPVWSVGSGDLGSCFFGEFDRVQKIGDTYAYGIPRDYTFPSSGIYGSRAHTLAANTRPDFTMLSPSNYTPNQFGGEAGVSPDFASGDTVFLDAPWVRESFGGNLTMRGYLPGMLTSPHRVAIANAPGSTISNINGVTGRLLVMSSFNNGTGGGFLLRLDEDWGDV